MSPSAMSTLSRIVVFRSGEEHNDPSVSHESLSGRRQSWLGKVLLSSTQRASFFLFHGSPAVRPKVRGEPKTSTRDAARPIIALNRRLRRFSQSASSAVHGRRFCLAAAQAASGAPALLRSNLDSADIHSWRYYAIADRLRQRRGGYGGAWTAHGWVWIREYGEPGALRRIPR